MRVLILWGESLGKPGGGTVHYRGLVGALRDLGHEVVTVTPRYGPQSLHSVADELRPVELGPRGLWNFARFQLRTVLGLRGWLRRHRPDVLYVRTCVLQGLLGTTSRRRGVPLVGEVDGLTDLEMLCRGEPAWAATLWRALDRVNCRLSDGLVCVTTALRDEMVRRGAPAAYTVAIPNGAPTDVMGPGDAVTARRAMGLPAEAVIVGFAGTFAPWQGLGFLVEAASHLAERPGRPAVHFALMGDGQMAPALRQDITRRGLEERFTLLPPGPHERVATMLAACDAVTIPRNDVRILPYGSPLKFFDAIAAGLPVLVPGGTDMDAILAELGLPGTFDPADPASLARAIEALADDVARHRARRAEVHAAVDRLYSWRQVAQRSVELFERLVARQRGTHE